MAERLGTAQIQAARYGLERLVFAESPRTLVPGRTSVFSAQNWNPVQGATWRVDLLGVAATRHTSVDLSLRADPKALLTVADPGPTRALPDNVTTQPVRVGGVQSVQMDLINRTAGNIANFAVAYRVELRRLTAVDKLWAQRAGLAGYDLTEAERQAIGMLNGDAARRLERLISEGRSPISTDWLIRALFEPRIVQETLYLFGADLSTTDRPVLFARAAMDAENPARGRFVVLRELALLDSPAPAMWIRVDRDGQLGHLSVRGDGLPDSGVLDLWIPAMDSLTIRAQRDSGSGTSYLRARVAVIEASELLAAFMGRIEDPQRLPDPAVWARAVAGVF